MAATLSSVKTTPLMGGYTMVSGLATGSSTYLTGGETMDLSAYILSSTSPIVMVGNSGQATVGYVGAHNQGTAAAGKVLFFEAGADSAALDEFANAGNAAVINVPFIAIGQTV